LYYNRLSPRRPGTPRALSLRVDIPRARPTLTSRWRWIAGGILAFVVITVLLSRLKPAAPTVERSQVLIGRVTRGPMLRNVRGSGRLVPEQIRYVSAVTGGRVDRVNVRPGAQVQAGTVLIEMSNPDVQLEALTAQQQLVAAEGQLVSLRTQLETARLNQAGLVAQVRTQLREAQRGVATAESLAVRNLNSPNEAARARDLVEELTERLQLERERLALMTATVDSQLTLQRDQVSRLRAIAEYQQARVVSMRVMAGADGVLQDLSLEVGQWVMSGTLLARVVQPGRLKAVLNIPEVQARDLALGQSAEVDTRLGLVRGRVIRMDPGAVNGNVSVDVGLEGTLPQGARPDLSVEGVIEIERLADVLQVGRPALAQAQTTVSLFRVDGADAERTQVRLGRASVNAVEVLGGLDVGDEVILSDMSRWEHVDRVRVR
jgi:multidrug efflux pump subunit AcrA (membrane-fusion protein)